VPIPLIPAGAALLAKAAAAAKGLVAVGGAAAGKKAAVTQLLIPGLKTAATKGAGLGVKGKLGSLGTRFMNSGAVPRTFGQAADRFGLDVLMGGVYGAMTPGDFGDKLIAGTTSAIGGAAGGMALRGAWSPTSNLGIQMAEVGGSIGGDMLANGVADGILRVKGGGTTPYEKMAAEQQRELEQRILRQYMSGKGGYPDQDPFLASNGLA
jgi:hypothetical protein